MEHFFAYGTLMCADLMQQVTGRHWDGAPALLKGYYRRAVTGEKYPALMPGKDGLVKGIVYRDVPDAIWERLDRFEGKMYTRHPVLVTQRDGTELAAVVYVIRPEFLDCLAAHDWDYAGFLRDDKAGIQQDCRRWMV